MNEAKTYLQEIERSDRLIQNKLAELYQLRCLASSVGSAPKGDAVQTSKTGDRMESLVVKIVDLENEINAEIDSFIRLKQERIKTIEKVSDTLQYSILHKHYVQYKTFGEIAGEEGYTYSWVLENHAKGLKKVQNIINNL